MAFLGSGALLEVFATPRGSTWTIAVTQPSGPGLASWRRANTANPISRLMEWGRLMLPPAKPPSSSGPPRRGGHRVARRGRSRRSCCGGQRGDAMLTLTTGDQWDDEIHKPVDNGCHPGGETGQHRRSLRLYPSIFASASLWGARSG